MTCIYSQWCSRGIFKVYFYFNIKSSEVAPQFSRKPLKLRPEPAQHNIDPLKLAENVCPVPGNDQQPQYNTHSSVFTCNCSPACQCVLEFATSKQSWKTYRMDMNYDELKEIVTKSKTPIFTSKKQTKFIRTFPDSDKKLSFRHEAQIIL